MARYGCCRHEPRLDELLADEMMTPVLRSAGIDQQRLHDLLAETARHISQRNSSAVDGEAR
jgi:hypothetical protein